MFAILAAGRLVSTDFQQVDPTHFVVSLPEADNINHVVIFLTGQQAFPENAGGAVYFSWPDIATGTPGSWQYLGFVSNAKPSAIFKLTKLREAEHPGGMAFGQVVTSVLHTAQIGISVEPLATIQGLSNVVGANPSNQEAYAEFVQKMLESFVNFASSFAQRQVDMTPQPNETFVPVSVVQKWYENFQRRLALNPMFWKG